MDVVNEVMEVARRDHTISTLIANDHEECLMIQILGIAFFSHWADCVTDMVQACNHLTLAELTILAFHFGICVVILMSVADVK